MTMDKRYFISGQHKIAKTETLRWLLWVLHVYSLSFQPASDPTDPLIGFLLSGNVAMLEDAGHVITIYQPHFILHAIYIVIKRPK